MWLVLVASCVGLCQLTLMVDLFWFLPIFNLQSSRLHVAAVKNMEKQHEARLCSWSINSSDLSLLDVSRLCQKWTMMFSEKWNRLLLNISVFFLLAFHEIIFELRLVCFALSFPGLRFFPRTNLIRCVNSFTWVVRFIANLESRCRSTWIRASLKHLAYYSFWPDRRSISMRLSHILWAIRKHLRKKKSSMLTLAGAMRRQNSNETFFSFINFSWIWAFLYHFLFLAFRAQLWKKDNESKKFQWTGPGWWRQNGTLRTSIQSVKCFKMMFVWFHSTPSMLLQGRTWLCNSI